MKIASFNIQNLFHRDRSLTEQSLSKCVTNWVTEFDNLLLKADYKNSTAERMRELSFLLGFDKNYRSPYAIMRKKSGELYLKGMSDSKALKADELTDWNGWIKVQTVPIHPESSNNKAKVIADINPDILILQEVEDKMSLDEFNNLYLPNFECDPFSDCIVIPNSEGKGREHALMLKNGYELDAIKLHTIDTSEYPTQELIEYVIMTPKCEKYHLFSTYFYNDLSNPEKSLAIRQQQARNTGELYQQLVADGTNNIIIAGTFNAPSYCDSLAPLLQETDLKDITKHLSFEVDYDEGIDASYHRMGAYRKGVNIRQTDFMLLSPSLFQTIADSGLNRKAMWPEKRPQWSTYKSVLNKNQAASEHPAVWGLIADI
ncbi:hypothetical protein M0G43_11935 [Subsaxibacter sp. CAU 1640]|uniref:hypothetical protein n=1 Tax=Subsaxibacter sp. CAU 1640 TaxID=2933271 RepID=UPI002005160C|nr:hypothetical protein [Subsaxibacter sp. CAU 1640]MCK7591287.1 hypothetical protein [Subsaxibacter sp. CAU 1640]